MNERNMTARELRDLLSELSEGDLDKTVFVFNPKNVGWPMKTVMVCGEWVRLLAFFPVIRPTSGEGSK